MNHEIVLRRPTLCQECGSLAETTVIEYYTGKEICTYCAKESEEEMFVS